uniref:Uncharacterized protein n=1 Tax=Anguilla anguilla TaxID=7936 RepID=A0A0E9U3P6_ANGAN
MSDNATGFKFRAQIRTLPQLVGQLEIISYGVALTKV